MLQIKNTNCSKIKTALNEPQWRHMVISKVQIYKVYKTFHMTAYVTTMHCLLDTACYLGITDYVTDFIMALLSHTIQINIKKTTK